MKSGEHLVLVPDHASEEGVVEDASHRCRSEHPRRSYPIAFGIWKGFGIVGSEASLVKIGCNYREGHSSCGVLLEQICYGLTLSWVDVDAARVLGLAQKHSFTALLHPAVLVTKR